MKWYVLTGENAPHWWHGFMALVWLFMLIWNIKDLQSPNRTFWISFSAWAMGVQSTIFLGLK